jgi:Flp pilus assembly pilin Flp
MDTLHPGGGRVHLAIRSVCDREDGQAFVEYALVLFLVSIVSIVLLGALGAEVTALFRHVSAVL